MSFDHQSKHPSQASNALGIIPARWGSSRFPGKPLALIHGKPLIQWTYENAIKCKLLSTVVVATDDVRIFDCVSDFGGQVVMTDSTCPTGTDRLADVIRRYSAYASHDIIVNIQGDEPCLSPQVIEQLIRLLDSDTEAGMATAATRFHQAEDLKDPGKVKCTTDKRGNALFFGRSTPVNYALDITKDPIYHHMGIYAFRRKFLLHYAELPETPLQTGESLEQLKVLEHGYRIKVALVNERALGVDTPEDAKQVEQWICKQNTYSSQAVSSLP